MAAALAGDWTLDHNENYDDFLKAVGMNSIKRAMAVKLGSSLVITANGDNGFQIKATNGPKTKDRKFVLGEEVEEEGADGTSAKGKFTAEDGKLVGRFVTKKGKNLIISRQIENGLLVQPPAPRTKSMSVATRQRPNNGIRWDNM